MLYLVKGGGGTQTFPSVNFDFINFVKQIELFFLGFFFMDEDDELERENETGGKMMGWLQI